MKLLKRILIALLVIAVLLTAVFLAGRYGWRLLGFRACQGAGITSVEVGEKAVRIEGFYPGSFPEGFCGCYSREREGTLYVGFRFSAVFGFFETGSFDVTIPVEGEINEVVLKTRQMESVIWTAEEGFTAGSEQYGVYVRTEGSDVYSFSMSYEGLGGGVSTVDSPALESGEYFFMDNDIMMAAKDAEAPVPFTVTVKDGQGNVAASGEFAFEAGMEKMYLTVTADGRIVEDRDAHG